MRAKFWTPLAQNPESAPDGEHILWNIQATTPVQRSVRCSIWTFHCHCPEILQKVYIPSTALSEHLLTHLHYRSGVGCVRGRGGGDPVQLPGVSLIPRPLEKWPGNCYVWDQTVYECSVTIPWSHSSSKYQISTCESWFLQLMRTRLRARGSNSDTIAFIICHVMTFWIWSELPTFWWQK